MSKRTFTVLAKIITPLLIAIIGIFHYSQETPARPNMYIQTTEYTAPANHPMLAAAKPISDCGSYKGKQLYRGPRGGCYYINRNGNKTYVDRSYCKCQ